jgi:hypothetical protein
LGNQLAKIVLNVGIWLLLASCQSGISSGVSVQGGPVSIAVMVDDHGQVILDTSVSVPLVGSGIVGVNWITSYGVVLKNAEQASNHLFIIYEDTEGYFHTDEYDIGQPFEVEFSENQHVEMIYGPVNGNIIVRVDVQSNASSNSSSSYVNSPSSNPDNRNNDSSLSCPGVSWSPRINIGDTVTVCTIERLRVRDSIDGDILFLLLPMTEGVTTLKILDGPFCGEESWWWKVEVPVNTMTNGTNTYPGAAIEHTRVTQTGYVTEGLDKERLPASQGYFLCP